MSYQAAESYYDSLFAPDTILPTQFFGGAHLGLLGGERKLMAALLSDGIEAYINYWSSVVANRKVELEGSEAVSWVETRDTAYVFSFDNVCESLGLDADYLRLGLARYVQALRSQTEGGAIWKRIRRPRK